MGDGVGEYVGAGVVGLREGDSVGFGVGTGDLVGDFVGFGVGTGDLVGDFVGFGVGTGDKVGEVVGKGVEMVGDAVGRLVGDIVGAAATLGAGGLFKAINTVGMAPMSKRIKQHWPQKRMLNAPPLLLRLSSCVSDFSRSSRAGVCPPMLSILD